ncbi:MAG: hypothetical protein ACR2RA_00550 [Geminicoccaceae bacterium]
MLRISIVSVALISLVGCATPLERAKQDGWQQLTGAEAVELHAQGLVVEGPNWTATWTDDGKKIVNSTQGVKELRWEARDGNFCQELYRSDQWDCGDLSVIAIKGDQYRSFNASGSLRDEGTIVQRGG